MQTFKEFALRLYGQPEVEAECLHWQDSHGVSVPLLLCCAWLDWRKVGCEPAQLQTLVAPVLAWEQDIVWPMRKLRREFKVAATKDAAAEQARERIKQAELQAELVVLDKLAALPWLPSPHSALASLIQHYQLAECDGFPALRQAVAALQPVRLTGPDN
ncbi:TIGR02444 family protein [Simiduia sp. 21SJ11W-1]|uniref:TIGR02444 family protein n=1 Tax=Simiduia sp. 21SJ11W-1 TaxID=2909669 RepID=UPI00209F385E|nr:TIGR02444 family protein [Simiduia sp. 21SJ11W-1]UTA48025.1 TIGR02444 family protein [Simiduia sp. 21SJ11W-1]